MRINRSFVYVSECNSINISLAYLIEANDVTENELYTIMSKFETFLENYRKQNPDWQYADLEKAAKAAGYKLKSINIVKENI